MLLDEAWQYEYAADEPQQVAALLEHSVIRANVVRLFNHIHVLDSHEQIMQCVRGGLVNFLETEGRILSSDDVSLLSLYVSSHLMC